MMRIGSNIGHLPMEIVRGLSVTVLIILRNKIFDHERLLIYSSFKASPILIFLRSLI